MYGFECVCYSLIWSKSGFADVALYGIIHPYFSTHQKWTKISNQHFINNWTSFRLGSVYNERNVVSKRYEQDADLLSSESMGNVIFSVDFSVDKINVDLIGGNMFPDHMELDVNVFDNERQEPYINYQYSVI